MIIIPRTDYIEYTNSGRSLSKEFYCLSLKKKFEVIAQMELEELIPRDYKLLDKLILAVLQHSPKSSIKDHPVNKERKIRPEAKAADLNELNLNIQLAMDEEINTHEDAVDLRINNVLIQRRAKKAEDVLNKDWSEEVTYTQEQIDVLKGTECTRKRPIDDRGFSIAEGSVFNHCQTYEELMSQAGAILTRPEMYFGTKDSYEDEPDYVKAKEILN